MLAATPAICQYYLVQAVSVIGAGGIGVALGWFLARAGWDVTMVDANPAKVQAGRRDGIALNGVPERKLRFVAFTDWLPSPRSLLLLCTKTYDNAAVLERVPQRSLLIPVQNGFDPLLEASDHALEGIASFVSHGEPDRAATRITRAGELHLGGRRNLGAGQRSILENLAHSIRAGGCRRVRVVPSITPYKCSKLMYNAAISPLAAAAGMDNEGLLRDPLAQRLFFTLLRENYEILRRSGARLAKIGPFHPAMVDRILRRPSLAKVLARFFRPGLRGTYCSMTPDVRTGRTEIAAYNGHLQKLARGRACPLNTAVIAMMRTMKDKGLTPHREMLVELGKTVGMGTLL
ncbi:MAG TPA: FAD-dependent oxidoreductase [Chthoniobacterales bacterium]